jgi:rhamnosyltransferase subunit B
MTERNIDNPPTARRIVLATLGSLGDLHPLLGLGIGLRARGHSVLVATSEFYRPRIEALGLEFAPLRPLASPTDQDLVRRVMDSRSGPQFLLRHLLLPHLQDMYVDLLGAVRGADFLIAGEIVLAAPLVTQKLHLPWASAILSPLSFFSVHDPGVIPLLPFAQQLAKAPPPVQQLLLQFMTLATRSWGRPIAHLRAQLGLPTDVRPLFRDRFSPCLNLALFDQVLGAPQPDWPQATHQCGFIYFDAPSGPAPEEALTRFLAAGPAPIVFTLGSTAVLMADDFFARSVSAARLLGRRALLIMGQNTRPVSAGDDVLCLDYAPYSAVFPRAACVVHQGGVGTTAQALRAGAPQLIVPYAFDQPDNASRIVQRGVGLQLPRTAYRARAVARQLQTLLEQPRFRRRATELASRIARVDGLKNACDAIALALHRPHPAARAATPQGRPVIREA